MAESRTHPTSGAPAAPPLPPWAALPPQPGRPAYPAYPGLPLEEVPAAPESGPEPTSSVEAPPAEPNPFAPNVQPQEHAEILPESMPDVSQARVERRNLATRKLDQEFRAAKEAASEAATARALAPSEEPVEATVLTELFEDERPTQSPSKGWRAARARRKEEAAAEEARLLASRAALTAQTQQDAARDAATAKEAPHRLVHLAGASGAARALRATRHAGAPEGSMIEAVRLTKRYDGADRDALHEVSFTVEPGEFAFLVGPSGSGKSTLLRLLLAAEQPSGGTLSVAGLDIGSLSHRRVPQLRRKLGCVFQDYALLPGKTAGQNVSFGLEVLGYPHKEIRPLVEEALDVVGLPQHYDTLPSQLSGGEQQRVAIARAIAPHPPLLLADEPTGNLDPATTIGIVKTLQRINRAGTTVIMATHDSAIVDSLRLRVLALAHGELARDTKRGSYTK